MQPTCSVRAILTLGSMSRFSRSITLVPCSRTRLMANRWAACDVGTDFCVGAIRQSTRLFGASGRHSERTTPCLIGKPMHRNLNRAFPYHSALFRGTQSGAAQHRVATDSLAAAILPIGAATSLSRSISFIPARLRLNANRWAAVIKLCSLSTVIEW